MTETGYKVVNTGAVKGAGAEGRLSSALVWGEEWACVYYEIGIFAHPKPHCGPLALFANEHAARSFISVYLLPTEGGIYLCDYTPSKVKWLWLMRPMVGVMEKHEFPHGTVLADSIRLTKKV